METEGSPVPDPILHWVQNCAGLEPAPVGLTSVDVSMNCTEIECRAILPPSCSPGSFNLFILRQVAWADPELVILL